MAGKEGTYTIPAASIEVDGKKIFSNALTVKVLPPDQSANGQQPGQGKGSSSASRAQIAGGKIFACGDAVSGASLVVKAMASGRKTAEAIDRFLSPTP